jgi:hypothetical protein
MNLHDATLMLLYAQDQQPIKSNEHLEWMLFLLAQLDPELMKELEEGRNKKIANSKRSKKS